jgi:hypothetical protein
LGGYQEFQASLGQIMNSRPDFETVTKMKKKRQGVNVLVLRRYTIYE